MTAQLVILNEQEASLLDDWRQKRSMCCPEVLLDVLHVTSSFGPLLSVCREQKS